MSIAKLNARRKAAGLPLIRFEVRRLQEDDVQDLRDAFAAMYEISATSPGDGRGYWALARGHGYDLNLCHTDDRVFLTWHRAYLYSFEKALKTALQWKRNDPSLELTLPFWDWTISDPETDADNGLPRLFDDETYVDANGQETPNPLNAALSMYRSQSQQLPAGQQFTQRFPDNFAGAVPGLVDDVQRLLSDPSFYPFSRDLDGSAHGTVHVVVGGSNGASPLPQNIGDMGSIVSAAFDPIFWFHHGMVDKIWFDWQSTFPNANIPAHVTDTVVYDGFKGSELLDAEHSLLYIYSSDDVEAAEEVGGTVANVNAPGSPQLGAPAPAFGAPPAPPGGATLYPTVRIGGVGGVGRGFRRAQLDFHQLRPPKASFEIRAFINNPAATAETAMSDPSYGGRIVLFGHGDCHGAKGHCNPALAARDSYDLRDPHPLRYQHTKYAMDVTRGLRRALKGSTAPMLVHVTFVTLDASGKAVPQDSVRYGGVSFSTR